MSISFSSFSLAREIVRHEDISIEFLRFLENKKIGNLSLLSKSFYSNVSRSYLHLRCDLFKLWVENAKWSKDVVNRLKETLPLNPSANLQVHAKDLKEGEGFSFLPVASTHQFFNTKIFSCGLEHVLQNQNIEHVHEYINNTVNVDPKKCDNLDLFFVSLQLQIQNFQEKFQNVNISEIQLENLREDLENALEDGIDLAVDQTIQNEHIEIAKFLLKNISVSLGRKFRAVAKDGVKKLSEKGNFPFVQLLMDANPNLTCYDKAIVLQNAVRHRNFDMIDRLLKDNSNGKIEDISEAMIVAVENAGVDQNTMILDYLLEKDTEKRFKDVGKVFVFAAKNGNIDVINRLHSLATEISDEDKVNALNSSKNTTSLELVQSIISSKKINLAEEVMLGLWMSDVLLSAIHGKNIEIARFLLNSTENLEEIDGSKLLFAAVHIEDLDACRMILESKLGKSEYSMRKASKVAEEKGNYEISDHIQSFLPKPEELKIEEDLSSWLK